MCVTSHWFSTKRHMRLIYYELKWIIPATLELNCWECCWVFEVFVELWPESLVFSALVTNLLLTSGMVEGQRRAISCKGCIGNNLKSQKMDESISRPGWSRLFRHCTSTCLLLLLVIQLSCHHGLVRPQILPFHCRRSSCCRWPAARFLPGQRQTSILIFSMPAGVVTTQAHSVILILILFFHIFISPPPLHPSDTP